LLTKEDMEAKIVVLNISDVDVPVRLTVHPEKNLWRAHAKYVDPFTKKEEFDSVTAVTKVEAERELLTNLTAFLKTRAQAE